MFRTGQVFTLEYNCFPERNNHQIITVCEDLETAIKLLQKEVRDKHTVDLKGEVKCDWIKTEYPKAFCNDSAVWIRERATWGKERP